MSNKNIKDLVHQSARTEVEEGNEGCIRFGLDIQPGFEGMLATSNHLDDPPECGEFNDNVCALWLTLYKLDNGQVESGLRDISFIWDFIIIRTQELKSRKGLLQRIRSVLIRFGLALEVKGARCDDPSDVKVSSQRLIDEASDDLRNYDLLG